MFDSNKEEKFSYQIGNKVWTIIKNVTDKVHQNVQNVLTNILQLIELLHQGYDKVLSNE